MYTLDFSRLKQICQAWVLSVCLSLFDFLTFVYIIGDNTSKKLVIGKAYTGDKLEELGYDIDIPASEKRLQEREWLASDENSHYIVLDIGNDNYSVIKKFKEVKEPKATSDINVGDIVLTKDKSCYTFDSALVLVVELNSSISFQGIIIDSKDELFNPDGEEGNSKWTYLDDDIDCIIESNKEGIWKY